MQHATANAARGPRWKSACNGYEWQKHCWAELEAGADVTPVGGSARRGKQSVSASLEVVKPGTAALTISGNGVTEESTLPITVQPVASLAVQRSDGATLVVPLEVKVGETAGLQLSTTDALLPDAAVTVKSSDATKVSIAGDTSAQAGNASATVTVKGGKATFRVFGVAATAEPIQLTFESGAKSVSTPSTVAVVVKP